MGSFEQIKRYTKPGDQEGVQRSASFSLRKIDDLCTHADGPDVPPHVGDLERRLVRLSALIQKHPDVVALFKDRPVWLALQTAAASLADMRDKPNSPLERNKLVWSTVLPEVLKALGYPDGSRAAAVESVLGFLFSPIGEECLKHPPRHSLYDLGAHVWRLAPPPSHLALRREANQLTQPVLNISDCFEHGMLIHAGYAADIGEVMRTGLVFRRYVTAGRDDIGRYPPNAGAYFEMCKAEQESTETMRNRLVNGTVSEYFRMNAYFRKNDRDIVFIYPKASWSLPDSDRPWRSDVSPHCRDGSAACLPWPLVVLPKALLLREGCSIPHETLTGDGKILGLVPVFCSSSFRYLGRLEWRGRATE